MDQVGQFNHKGCDYMLKEAYHPNMLRVKWVSTHSEINRKKQGCQCWSPNLKKSDEATLTPQATKKEKDSQMEQQSLSWKEQIWEWYKNGDPFPTYIIIPVWINFLSTTAGQLNTEELLLLRWLIFLRTLNTKTSNYNKKNLSLNQKSNCTNQKKLTREEKPRLSLTTEDFSQFPKEKGTEWGSQFTPPTRNLLITTKENSEDSYPLFPNSVWIPLRYLVLLSFRVLFSCLRLFLLEIVLCHYLIFQEKRMPCQYRSHFYSSWTGKDQRGQGNINGRSSKCSYPYNNVYRKIEM